MLLWKKGARRKKRGKEGKIVGVVGTVEKREEEVTEEIRKGGVGQWRKK